MANDTGKATEQVTVQMNKETNVPVAPSVEMAPSNDIYFNKIFNKDTFRVDWSYANSVGAATFGPIFNAHLPCEVVRVSMSWTAHSSAGGSGAMQLEKLTPGTAPDSGVVILAAVVDLTGTNDTPVFPTLTATKANRVLDKGDRLCLKDSGTLTDLRGLVVSVELKPLGQGHYRVI